MTGVLQALDRYYDRLAAQGDVVPPGYSVEPIGLVVTLGQDGSLIDLTVRLDPSGKRPKAERVPKWFGRQGTGSTPYFLWDNTAYALGISNKDPRKTERDHATFKTLHYSELENEEDKGLKALRLFLENWVPDPSRLPDFHEKMLSWNVAFRLAGDSKPNGEPRLLHERPAASSHIEHLKSAGASYEPVFCLVTGEVLPPARLHPKIKGVDGTSSAEVPLVSFNEDAFESYGRKQSLNAPTSEGAAFRYGAALNRLLDRSKENRLRQKVVDTTVVFWADASATGEDAAQAAESIFAFMLEPPDDETEAAKLRDALDDFAKGRPVPSLDPGLVKGTRFHVLGLAPNAARLSVRYWLEDDFSEFAKRLAEHYRDLAIDPAPWGHKLPSVSRLLVKTTALQEKFDNIPPLLAGEVMRAVLGGTSYPRTLLSAAIARLRAGDAAWTGWHAAAIKACLNRSDKETVPMALDPDNPSAAYQLGRLFAVLEAAQYAALGRVNAPISTRYYGSASATPARVFGPLLRGLRHHVADALKQGRGGWIDRRVGEIMARLPAELPRTLRLEEQGRFAIGYYHERAFRPAQSEEATPDEPDIDNQGANQ